MPRRWLLVMIPSLLVFLGVGRSNGQDVGRLRYVPTPDDIAQFFHGELSASDHVALAYCRDLHLMEETPLAGAGGAQAHQVYRLVVETRPYNTPVVVRLSIGTEGTGQIVAKVGQSVRFPDILTVDRTADVSRVDVDQFLKLLTNSGFWSMPVLPPFDLHHVALGEPGWMLEGGAGGSYRVAWRNTSALASLKDPVMFLVLNIGKVDLASTATRPGGGSHQP
jgi:hypothetical protein